MDDATRLREVTDQALQLFGCAVSVESLVERYEELVSDPVPRTPQVGSRDKPGQLGPAIESGDLDEIMLGALHMNDMLAWVLVVPNLTFLLTFFHCPLM